MKNAVKPDASSAPSTYWEKAGEVSYAEAMFASGDVAHHINQRMWGAATEIGFKIGIKSSDRILDLGCGDGAFANQWLAEFFTQVDGYDLSVAGIERANKMRAHPDFQFHMADVTTIDYKALVGYNGVFMMGILHHVKKSAAQMVRSMHGVAPRVVVLEPNGAHPVRKLLEFTPSYRRAGEESFRARAVIRMFEDAGFELKEFCRMGLFPNFTPAAIVSALRPLEAKIEASPLLSLLCTANIFGFVQR